MPNILIVEKSGVIKEVTIKTFSQEELYKKAGFKTGNDFKMVHSWTIEIQKTSVTITLYGKSVGRAGQENKYEFPPPVDTILFFGSCILVSNVSSDNKTCGNLSIDQWEEIYETLYGGFEEIGDESETEEEDELDSDIPHLKDGFITYDEDEEFESDEDEDYESDEDEISTIKKKVKIVKNKKKTSSNPKKKVISFDKIDSNTCEESFLDCSSELIEEEYV
jgi:hypothetical protein